MKNKLWILVSTFTLFGCSASVFLKPSIQMVESKYSNGKKRTEYYLRNNSIDSTYTLFDTSGSICAQFDSRVKVQPKNTNYLGIDSNAVKKLDPVRIGKETDFITEILSKKYSKEFPLFRKGESTYLLWIDSLGIVEHAVCLKYKNISIKLVEQVGNELEQMKIPVEAIGKGLIAKQKITFQR